jgi:hypothetical protein
MPNVKYYLKSQVSDGVNCIHSILPDMTEEQFRRLQEIQDAENDLIEPLSDEEADWLFELQLEAQSAQELAWEVVRVDHDELLEFIEEDFER